MCIVFELLLNKKQRVLKDIICIFMALVLVSNIYIANKSYLELHMAYENAYAFYTSIITQIKMTSGFDENSKLAIIGKTEESNYLEKFEKGGSEKERSEKNIIKGINLSLKNVYSRNSFITYYLGFDIEFATEEEISILQADERFEEMEVYPYYGSVQKIDNYIVVKLS